MRIRYHKSFDKKFLKLSHKLQAKCKERISLFLSDSFHSLLNNHGLQGKYVGCRSINITGDYRAIYKLLADDLVLFINVGTHPELYG